MILSTFRFSCFPSTRWVNYLYPTSWILVSFVKLSVLDSNLKKVWFVNIDTEASIFSEHLYWRRYYSWKSTLKKYHFWSSILTKALFLNLHTAESIDPSWNSIQTTRIPSAHSEESLVYSSRLDTSHFMKLNEKVWIYGKT